MHPGQHMNNQAAQRAQMQAQQMALQASNAAGKPLTPPCGTRHSAPITGGAHQSHGGSQ
jgi:hypothetical protein